MSESVINPTGSPLAASQAANTNAPVGAATTRQEVSESGNASPQQADQEVSREEVLEAVRDISDYVQNISRELNFQVDDLTGSTVITVLDRETEQVVRQIPSEEVVAIARYITENAPDPVKGLLMNSEG